ncbi:Zinc Finger And Scan Domain-Containing Protein 32 [Manis pentadactyla]|nr:Zinc Finger And Scan Domain-Containing Protein 32 [Manis pentadactyla]
MEVPQGQKPPLHGSCWSPGGEPVVGAQENLLKERLMMVMVALTLVDLIKEMFQLDGFEVIEALRLSLVQLTFMRPLGLVKRIISEMWIQCDYTSTPVWGSTIKASLGSLHFAIVEECSMWMAESHPRTQEEESLLFFKGTMLTTDVQHLVPDLYTGSH